MSDSIVLALPWPPSVSKYHARAFRDGRAIHRISDGGRRYHRDIEQIMLGKGEAPYTHDVPLSVLIYASPPDARPWMLHDGATVLIDSMRHSGIIQRDAVIDQLQIVRKEVVELGHIIVEITPL
jgi:Holliday junction resolvase RusA-like endonuclease